MAQQIPQEVIEEVRRQANIVDVVGQYVQLKKAGKNYSGLCPFHDEKTPSFTVAEDKQLFHCFGCGKGGNVFRFVQEIEGMRFPEAVAKVAEFGGVTLPDTIQQRMKQQTATSPQDIQQNRLIAMHEKATELYHHILMHTKVGEPAYRYLKERGITDEQIEHFQLGFAPGNRQLLAQVFTNEETDVTLYETSGLLIQRDSGEWIDRFFDRIMFPIMDSQGKVIAFSGRIIPNEQQDKSTPKYLNSPETPLFNKRLTLYHFDQARKEARKSGEFLLFEGFMDVMAAWRAGFSTGIASMGTSLTDDQIRMMKRVTTKIIVCYDGDRAGVEATYRATEHLAQAGMDCRVIRLPEQKDPDEYLQAYGSDALAEALLHSRESVFTFRMHYHQQNRQLENEQERVDYLTLVLGELVKVDSLIEREQYLQQLSQEFQLSMGTLEAEFQKRLAERPKGQSGRSDATSEWRHGGEPDVPPPLIDDWGDVPPQAVATKLTRVDVAERLLFYRLLNETAVRAQLAQEAFAFAHDAFQELYMHLLSYLELSGDVLEVADFLSYLREEHLKQLVTEVAYMTFPEESSGREITDCMQVIRSSALEEELKSKREQQLVAVRTGNHQVVQELTLEIIRLQQQLRA